MGRATRKGAHYGLGRPRPINIWAEPPEKAFTRKRTAAFKSCLFCLPRGRFFYARPASRLTIR